MNETNNYKEKFYERYIKRVFDIMISIFTLIFLSPLALICSIAIKLDDPSAKVIFRQERNGRYGKVFNIVKFRTMKKELCGVDVDPNMDTLTGVGKIVRKFSLDEIPQFWSILNGQMSLIGPRPLLVPYYAWYTKTELRRFDVRPGLTGLSQINGRANLSWDERFSLDVQYVDNISFLYDVKIFFKTFFVVFSHKYVIPEKGYGFERFDEYRRRKQEESEKIVVAFRKPAKQTKAAYQPKSRKISG